MCLFNVCLAIIAVLNPIVEVSLKITLMILLAFSTLHKIFTLIEILPFLPIRGVCVISIIPFSFLMVFRDKFKSSGL